jgi:1-acyl-sn-glycerol-3-phosphate acyltransferase
MKLRVRHRDCFPYFTFVFYSLLKGYARLAIRIYCKRIIINKPQVLQYNGPLLLACNHPNSFLDGMILTTLFDQPVYSLARGDVFKKRWTNKFLRRLQLLPLYRTSEGVENLEHNYTTFDACRRTFEESGIVLIFSEGRCENEWRLRPLKKGTARLAITSWEQRIPVRVIPTALNYSSFGKFGKEVHLFFGDPVDSSTVLLQETEGKRYLNFNEQLWTQLQQFVYEISPADQEKRRRLFSIKHKSSLYLLMIPALIGWLLHAPLFYIIKLGAERMRGSGHYDSIMTSLLLISYPFYLLAVTMISFGFFSTYGLSVILLSPLTAWACVQVKYQLDI